MKSSEIKQFLQNTFGLKRLSVTKHPTKNPFYPARIKSIGGAMELKYDEEFPLKFRQYCLRVIYGSDCDFAEGGSAGNVSPHDIAMQAREWERTIDGWSKETL